MTQPNMVIIYSYFGPVDDIKQVLIGAMDDPDLVIQQMDSNSGEIVYAMSQQYQQSGTNPTPMSSSDLISIPELEYFILGLYVNQQGVISDVIDQPVRNINREFRSYIRELHQQMPGYSFVATHTNKILDRETIGVLIDDIPSLTIESTYNAPDSSFTAVVVDLI